MSFTEEASSAFYLYFLLQLFLSCRVSNWFCFFLDHLLLLYFTFCSNYPSRSLWYCEHFFPAKLSCLEPSIILMISQYDLLFRCSTVILQLIFTALLRRSHSLLVFYFFLDYPFFFLAYILKGISSESTMVAELSDCIHVWKYFLFLPSQSMGGFAVYRRLGGKSFSLRILNIHPLVSIIGYCW